MPEQNGDHVEVLEKPPSALEFSQLVHVSRPVVIKEFKIPASTSWTDEYLINRMGSRKISMATTPDGLADAVTSGPDDQLYFVEPHLEKMTMEEFLSDISRGSSSASSDVCYLQSQNGNLYSSSDFFEEGRTSESEFQPLRRDVPSDISWCTEALGVHTLAVTYQNYTNLEQESLQTLSTYGLVTTEASLVYIVTRMKMSTRLFVELSTSRYFLRQRDGA